MRTVPLIVGLGVILLAVVLGFTRCDPIQEPPSVVADKEAAPAPADTQDKVEAALQHELEELYTALVPPAEEDLPLPPEGWYTLELAGDSTDVFRDEYGVPHVFAPSPEAAFRAQGYVMMEDRCIQLLWSRMSVRGLRSLQAGPGRIQHDTDVRVRGFTDDELQEMIDALRPEQRQYSHAYIDGVNEYLAYYAPHIKPLDMLELAAGAVYFLRGIGDWGGDEHHMHKLVNLVETFRGKEFAWNMLNDCIPLNVPTAPTTDHSHKYAQRTYERPPPRPDYLDVADMVRIGERQAQVKTACNEDNQITRWGSFAWTVRPERSTTGNALFYGAPMLGFGMPPRGVMVHLVAPGMNVAGMAFPGTPGVLIGHNDRVAFTSTSGLMDTTDMFVETTNPENAHQYWYKGEWRDMESFESPFPVRNEDGTYRMQPLTVYRTVHGPVVDWNVGENRVYSRATSFRGMELQSFLAFFDMNFAETVDDIEMACREIGSTHNVFAADIDGNIGYWLAGHIPNRCPDADPRLPVPGTGEYDWQGLVCHTDLVASVNPPEGWFANWNQKPSVKTPLWFPEGIWGIRMFQIFGEENPISWERFWEVNKENGVCHFLAVYLKPCLLRVIKERGDDAPEVTHAVRLLEGWPNIREPGASAALLFEEWTMETMVRLFSPDFGPLVVRSLKLQDMRLFGALMMRILQPETAGIPVNGDYLHGRDPDQIAYDAFRDVLDKLIEKHGPVMGLWPYEPKPVLGGDKDPLKQPLHRDCGTYWMALDMGERITGVWMLVPGQSERKASPHHADQYDLFLNWQASEMKFYPDEFGPRVAHLAAQ